MATALCSVQGVVMVEETSRYIVCAYCEAKFETSDEWFVHIPCKTIKEAEKPQFIELKNVQAQVSSKRSRLNM